MKARDGEEKTKTETEKKWKMRKQTKCCTSKLSRDFRWVTATCYWNVLKCWNGKTYVDNITERKWYIHKHTYVWRICAHGWDETIVGTTAWWMGRWILEVVFVFICIQFGWNAFCVWRKYFCPLFVLGFVASSFANFSSTFKVNLGTYKSGLHM
jgi:hypothetical protein